MVKNIGVKELKQYLKERTQDELIADIVKLYNKLDSVRDYYQIQLSGAGSPEMLERYKAIIKHEFFPTRGLGQARLSVARRAVTDYKKDSSNPVGLADLMIYYVEMGVDYTNSYGDIDEGFYSSMERMYEQALKLITKENLQEQFKERCAAIVYNTRGIGWGFHDGLSDLYTEYFPDSV